MVRKGTRTHVSKDARVAAVARRREASHKYKMGLDDAWIQMDKTIENLATQHQKSVKQVRQQLHLGRSFARGRHSKNSYWNAFLWKKGQDHKNDESKPFCLLSKMLNPIPQAIDASPSRGNGYLPHASRESSGEYEALTKDEKELILAEFEEYKASKETGYRVSTKSRLNDCTHTVRAITNEVLFLLFASYVWH